MSYRDVHVWLRKASEAIVLLGIKRGEVDTVRLHSLACLAPVIEVEPACFARLCQSHRVRPEISRVDDFLHGSISWRGFAITTSVWSKSTATDAGLNWQLINDLSRPALEVDRPKIGVTRAAIADRRRLIGLPAPKVIDV